VRKRIFLFHTLTLIAAMAVILAVSGGAAHWTVNYYQRKNVPAADDRSHQVQTLLEDWDGEGWDTLGKALGKLDYRLVVTRAGTTVFSSLDPFQEKTYRLFSKDASWPESGTLTVQNEGIVMVGCRIGPYTVAALPRPNTPPLLGRQRPQTEAILLSVLIIGTAAIAVIVPLSLLFTRYHISQIMRPVNALTQAAQRVEEGDLSAPVDYTGHDEFSAVCAAFDHMQSHLLEEREKNAAYERARTDLVAGISHDLRTPLTSVKGYIKGMRDGVANTPEKQALYLDIAYRKACDMDRLLQRLFYFSKLETGSLPVFSVRTDLSAFVRGFAHSMQEELIPLGGQVVLNVGLAPLYVLLDEEQMLRVLTNLKENALRYAGAQPLVLTLTLRRHQNQVCLSFADNGGGVPQDQLPFLFQQFWRGDRARGNPGGEGSGLGLYIVKHIVEAHGGTIQAENDGGLVFHLTLPCLEE